MKTKDGRFSYEAAGDRVAAAGIPAWIGGAARAWRGSSIFRRPLSRHRLGHAGLWRFGAAATVSIAPRRCPAGFPAQVGATKPVLVGHSIGGMIVQQLLVEQSRASPARSSWRRPARPSAKRTATGRKLHRARLGPLDRGETMVSLAPTLVQELVGDDPDPGGMSLPATAWPRAGGDLSRHDAGADGVRSAQRAWRISRCRRWCCRARRTTMRRRR